MTTASTITNFSSIELHMLPGSIPENNTSSSLISRESRGITKKNLVDILSQEHVPKKLIEPADIHAELAIKILNQRYMKFFRFNENDQPFEDEVCCLLTKNIEIIRASQKILDARDNVETTTCCSCYDSLSDNKKNLLLIVGVIVLIFLLYFPFEKYLEGTVLLDMIIVLRIIVPAGTVVIKMYSVRENRKEKAILREKNRAQKNYDRALLSTEKTLEKQKQVINEIGKELIIDYKDGFPFAYLAERAGELNKYKVADRNAMAFKADFIKHFANHFGKKIDLITSALEKFIQLNDHGKPLRQLEKVLKPSDLLEDLISAANTIADIPIPNKASMQTMSDFFRLKDMSQSHFIKVAYSIDNNKVQNSFPMNATNYEIAQMFPLSCGSFDSVKELTRTKINSSDDKKDWSQRERKSTSKIRRDSNMKGKKT